MWGYCAVPDKAKERILEFLDTHGSSERSHGTWEPWPGPTESLRWGQSRRNEVEKIQPNSFIRQRNPKVLDSFYFTVFRPEDYNSDPWKGGLRQENTGEYGSGYSAGQHWNHWAIQSCDEDFTCIHWIARKYIRLLLNRVHFCSICIWVVEKQSLRKLLGLNKYHLGHFGCNSSTWLLARWCIVTTIYDCAGLILFGLKWTRRRKEWWITYKWSNNLTKFK